MKSSIIGILHGISTLLIVAIGIIHTTMTPVFYDDLSEAAFWFAGTGLAAIFIGLLNILLWRAGSTDPAIRGISQVANLLFLIFMMIGTSIMPGLQTYSFFVIALAMTGSAFYNTTWGVRRENDKRGNLADS